MVYKRVRGWTSGRTLPVQNFVEYPPGTTVTLFTGKSYSGYAVVFVTPFIRRGYGGYAIKSNIH